MFVQKHENKILGLFQDNSRTFSVFKDSISLTFSQFFIVFAGNGDSEKGRTSFLSPEYFIMVLINTGTSGKLNQSTVTPRSSTNPAIFTLFSFVHRINPKEWKRIGVFYYFQGQFHIFQGNITKYQDNSRTNGTILKIPGVFQNQGQIQGLFQVCADPVDGTISLIPKSEILRPLAIFCGCTVPFVPDLV